MITKKETLLNTRSKTIIAALAALLISYGLGSWAIDSGSYWAYGGCILFLIIAVKLFIQAIKN